MKSTYRQLLSKVLPHAFALTDSLSEGTGVISSFIALGTSYPLAWTMGGTTFLVRWITNYFFKGEVMRENLADKKMLIDLEKPPENLEEKEVELLPLINTTIPTKKKAAFLGIEYGYIIFDIGSNLSGIILLYSASKAWIITLTGGEDQPIAAINTFELTMILTYFFFSDLLFIITNEIPQAYKGIKKRFGFLDENVVPDEKFKSQLKHYLKPILESKFAQNYVRISGSIGDTAEHTTRLVLFIPPSFILKVWQLPSVFKWGIIGVTGLALITITSTILIVTLLFEGKYSADNMKDFAGTIILEENEPWIPYKASKVLKNFLYLEALPQGADVGLSYLLTLRELGLNTFVSYLTGGTAFLIGCAGNLFSEVEGSQKALEEITKPNPSTMLSSSRKNSSRSSRIFPPGEYNRSQREMGADDDLEKLTQGLKTI